MNKMQKKQVETFINEFEQLHNEIEHAIKNGKSDTAMELLGQCQQDIIELGELIENTEGEGCITVSLLENYCEHAYKLYEKVRLKQSANVGDSYVNLCESLKQIKSSIHNDIQSHCEDVFLPYKAHLCGIH